jgi:hypothetical protein
VRASTRWRTPFSRQVLATLVLLMTLGASACAGQDQRATHPVGGSDETNTATAAPEVDPDDFVGRIDNPYMPLEPGTTRTYEGTTADGMERTVVQVTDQTREILGVTATVVRDRVYLKDELIEDTRDWFAQDREGNVWYFGEDSKEIKNGKVVNREGSWEAGVDGARPGIAMKADPRSGDEYAQEVAPGVAEDRAEVLSLDETIEVAYDSYENVLKTKDTNPLDPGVVEHKYYARDVGLIAEEEAGAREERAELVGLERP